MFQHTPVLLQEAIQYLTIQPKQWYLDGTVGGAGHTLEILKQGGYVLAIDQDTQALQAAQQRVSAAGLEAHIRFVHGNFKGLAEIAKRLGIQPVGVLLDLGVSSFQLSGQDRGFSFQVDEALDMRMDPDNQQVTAQDLVNGLYEKELSQLIQTYGEDPLARAIARHIVRTRNLHPIVTTQQLAKVVEEVYRKQYSGRSRKNPATRTFQALRMAVNDELNSLREALEQTMRIVAHPSRVVIISFHGLEDAEVKKTFQLWEQGGSGHSLTSKPITAGEAEIQLNPRSRSAKLRAFEITSV